MSKKVKKRNKPYQGPDAASAQPNIRKYTAVKRSRLGEWWFEKKRTVKIVSIITFIVGFVAIIIAEIVSLLSGAI